MLTGIKLILAAVNRPPAPLLRPSPTLTPERRVTEERKYMTGFSGTIGLVGVWGGWMERFSGRHTARVRPVRHVGRY